MTRTRLPLSRRAYSSPQSLPLRPKLPETVVPKRHQDNPLVLVAYVLGVVLGCLAFAWRFFFGGRLRRVKHLAWIVWLMMAAVLVIGRMK